MAAAASNVATNSDIAEIPAGVGAYQSAMKELTDARGRQSLQPLFENGTQVSPELQAVLPSLSEAQFQQVQRAMQGFVIVRAQRVFARPSASFFKALANKKGTKADRAFFDIFERTEPDANGGFPSYILQQTDEGGCTRFDGKQLVDLYRGWVTFRTAYPDDYATQAQGEIDSLESELVSGICTCGDAAKTSAGLQTFVDAFPDLPITPKIRDRIAAIRAAKSSFRFNCKAG